MPELNFQVLGVEAVERGMVPLLQFRLALETRPPGAEIQAVMLQAQLQLQPAQRAYSPAEKERLIELFGTPERWGQTLRNRLWTHAQATVGAFQGRTECRLPVLCSYDLNLASAKYFYALETGEVALLFLFSGSVFYPAADGRLQVERISWNQECLYRLPVEVWRQLMESHYPNSAWLYVRRDLFERLYAWRRRRGLGSWDETLAALLDAEQGAGREPTAKANEPRDTAAQEVTA